mmetsp:Transcript_39133/g.88872  ORF Transcript_39133/g.88872 Transcript_39133/m.88872 type:complete len:389 (-) Transcript_39133:316-1482(-)
MLAPWLVLQPSTATRQVGALKKPNVGLNKASRAPSVWVPTLSACQSAKREAVWHSKPPPTDLAKVGHLACLEEVDRTCRDLTGEMCDRSPLGGSLESQRSEHSALLGQLEENERPLPTTVKTMVKTQKELQQHLVLLRAMVAKPSPLSVSSAWKLQPPSASRPVSSETRLSSCRDRGYKATASPRVPPRRPSPRSRGAPTDAVLSTLHVDEMRLSPRSHPVQSVLAQRPLTLEAQPICSSTVEPSPPCTPRFEAPRGVSPMRRAPLGAHSKLSSRDHLSFGAGLAPDARTLKLSAAATPMIAQGIPTTPCTWGLPTTELGSSTANGERGFGRPLLRRKYTGFKASVRCTNPLMPAAIVCSQQKLAGFWCGAIRVGVGDSNFLASGTSI